MLVVLAATFVASKIAGKHSVIDTAWGLLFVRRRGRRRSSRSAGHGDPVRRWLLLVLPVLWGLRLAVHIGRRSIGKPEDPRYDELLAKAQGQPRPLRAAHGLPAAGPAGVRHRRPDPGRRRSRRGPVGVARLGRRRRVGASACSSRPSATTRWSASARDPAQQGQGHRRRACGATPATRTTSATPACGGGSSWSPPTRWPGVLTIFAPVVMTLLLTKGSGARILEKHMATRRGLGRVRRPHQRVLPAAAQERADLAALTTLPSPVRAVRGC